MEKQITRKHKTIVVAIIVLIAILVNLPSIPKRWYITDKIYLGPGNISNYELSYHGNSLQIYRYFVDDKNDMVFMESRYEPFYLVLRMDGSTLYEENELISLPEDIQSVFNNENIFTAVSGDSNRRHVYFN